MNHLPDENRLNFIKLDFDQAKARHLQFKSRLRSILYGIDVDEAPVASHYECTVGKWIYGHAMQLYGHLPEMQIFEKTHAEIHTCARELLKLYKDGLVEEARKGLARMENIADALIADLNVLEQKIMLEPLPVEPGYSELVTGNLEELYALQKANNALDIKIKEQSKELFKAKERFELVAKATQDAVWDWDLDSNELWWNDGFKDLFGYTSAEIEPGVESWYNRLHPDDKLRVVTGLHEVIDNGGRKWSDEYRFLKSDGTYAFIYDRGYALHDKNGKPYRMVGSMQDITYKKEAELKFAKSADHFKFLAESIPQKVWTADVNGHVNYCNRVWLEYIGKTLEEMRQDDWEKLVHPDDLQPNLEKWKMAIETGNDFEIEHRLLRKDGRYRWHLSRGIAQKDVQGNIVLWVGTNTDIDDQKMFAEELENKVRERTFLLQEANESLKRSNAELEQFAYITSHDLQEPLRKIQVFTNMLLDRHGLTLNDDALKYVEKVSSAAKRMSGLTKDLLEYSGLTQSVIQFEQVNMNTVLQDILTDFELLITQKKATITADELPILQAAPLQINQLFYNLVGNALKFTKKGVPAQIKISSMELTKAMMKELPQLNNKKRYYKIIFSDNGIGFGQEYASKIFTIFQRLNDRSLFSGYGIGLAICNKIVNKHKGVIYAEGIEMQGATFTVILPAEQDSAYWKINS